MLQGTSSLEPIMILTIIIMIISIVVIILYTVYSNIYIAIFITIYIYILLYIIHIYIIEPNYNIYVYHVRRRSTKRKMTDIGIVWHGFAAEDLLNVEN
jgi:FlaA1/EpsC-like NDP-sugar epimerase